ncbi:MULTISPECIES: phosphopantetheine adenylyltransferase [Methanobacterium]|uniref:Phosphopantetheine adenylyltransferase n=1 Tax=Methanobacterium veterum TaxID=408577 RepID=A0A9E4ZX79_9EURY|nr:MULTISPECIES: phosphopantetheine adenylyltransferase [Methanobacterium]MCZ3364914.1 phosphopantetheine adenylyltransferase [Methanobacterium veterum]MCZ3372669.1 phosphopantetheine adenylyltransferase [Methanobacterium veterum]
MKYKNVAVGGTFDHFHRGHEKLLNKAFEIGNYIMVGVTSNEFGGKKGNIEPCSKRMFELEEFLQKFNSRYTLKRLEEPYGPTVHDPEIDAIVVSKETEPVAHKINEIRDEKGIKPLKIFVIGWVLAEDGKPISSTRIRNGEIDRNGKVLK